ncbi:MAG: basic amino acid/polyamine antiporter, family [Micromonosporaceae bacterium]|jgi:APA family basic amino acid/polyamine antiporter|nr:basic amino acid/polyamine antiporter, family [Micromonosporaceae bacterium]MDT5036369.1 basic amino acid/polyamine antiporter, family [Micromonosporaceae bacterium]
MNLWRTKTIEQSIADTEEPAHQLRKRLGPVDLTVFGVGVIIGTGIFVLTGKAAGVQAGPAVALSFVFAGIACGLAALCYAEFASTVPVAGSAYTFSYASLGEMIAWIIGWDLILELALGASTVAVGWSTYFADVMKSAGITIPAWAYGNGHNLVAAAIICVLTGVICLGIKVSSQVNMVMVIIKLSVVLFVIIAGLFYIKTGNYSPFIPPAGSPGAAGATSTPSLLQDLGFAPGSFGVSGIFTGAALVFFAFIGFDIVATAAEETRKPQRDMPIGILASLAICTALYVAVSLVVTGMVKYTSIKIDAPLAAAFRSVGKPGFATVVSVGALIGLTTVMMILMLGQSRVFFAMSRDRLLPPAFSKVSQRFGSPVRTSVTTGVVVALLSTFVPLTELAELVNIGTLFAFVLVAVGVLVLRRTRPDLPRAFRCPGVPVIPVLAVLTSLYLMLNLPAATWIRFVVWMAIGFVVYFAYGARHSRLVTDPNYSRQADAAAAAGRAS